MCLVRCGFWGGIVSSQLHVLPLTALTTIAQVLHNTPTAFGANTIKMPSRLAVFSRKNKIFVCPCDLMNGVCIAIHLCVCAYPWCCGEGGGLSEGNVCVPASCQWRLAGRDGSVEGGKHRSLIPLNQVSLQRTGFKVNKCVCVCSEKP